MNSESSTNRRWFNEELIHDPARLVVPEEFSFKEAPVVDLSGQTTARMNLEFK